MLPGSSIRSRFRPDSAWLAETRMDQERPLLILRRAGEHGGMPDLVKIGQSSQPAAVSTQNVTPRSRILWLQGVTLGWMAVEFGVSAYAAITAHSPVLLAFGSDSLVELLSATVVLFQWVSSASISERMAARAASVLLFAVAGVVVVTAVVSLILRLRPESSCAGIGITMAALLAMPVLAWLKRRESRRMGNTALAADAAQSAACAYLALIALIGLAANALFHIAWFDGAPALFAVPILIREAGSAWKGQNCACC
jgi:divalent metal cation (Fe/Co/Zn/Cd) transporter